MGQAGLRNRFPSIALTTLVSKLGVASKFHVKQWADPWQPWRQPLKQNDRGVIESRCS